MILYLLITVGFLALTVFAAVYFKDVLPLVYHGAPWQPAEIEAVRKMLKMAEVKPGEQVIDLGSGDGRVLIMAAKEFGARAIGIEINPFLAVYSRLRIRAKGLSEKAQVVRGDLFRADIGSADVIVLFQRQGTNERLREKLARETKPTARLVSYVWEMKSWETIKSDPASEIYVYSVPRKVT